VIRIKAQEVIGMVLTQIPKSVGFIYALAMIVLIAYLWYSGRWKKQIGWLVLIISSAFGFLIFSPVAPYQFQQLVLRDVEGLGGPLIVGVIGLFVLFLLTFAAGRVFCGYLCPVGTLQEIAYHVPVPKTVPRQKTAFMAVRAFFFIAVLLLALGFSVSLLAVLGIHDLFHLLLTTGSVVFLMILLLSMTLYRPFCRLVCPYGALLSLAAGKSLLRLHRTDACIDCKKCENACPTDEAKRGDAKAECYLCGRCTDVCPATGALKYDRTGTK
jgi:ferredoxin-type protein NapH